MCKLRQGIVGKNRENFEKRSMPEKARKGGEKAEKAEKAGKAGKAGKSRESGKKMRNQYCAFLCVY